MSFRIHLVRNGQSSGDGLSGTGHDQAQAVGQRLARILSATPGFQHLRIRMLVAPAVLTRQTADGMYDGLTRGGHEYERRECTQLRSRSFGIHDGIERGSTPPRYPMPLESLPQICDRLRLVFDSIHRSARHPQPVTDTIVVAHHPIIQCFIDEWLHRPWDRRPDDTGIGFCSIRRIGRDDGGRWTDTETYEGFPGIIR